MEFTGKSRQELIDELLLVRQELDSLKTSAAGTHVTSPGTARDHWLTDRLLSYTVNSPMAIIEMDSEFVVTKWTGNSESMLGWSAEEAVGKSMMELNLIFDADLPAVGETIQVLLSGKEPWVKFSNRNVRKDGKVIYCNWYNTILPDSQGKMQYVLSQAVDVTAQKIAEEGKFKSEELLDLMGQTAQIGGWLIDVETMVPTWTREVYHIHELDFSFKPTVKSAINFYTPNSRPILEQAVEKAIITGEPFDLELEFFTATGKKKWVRTIGKSYQENGKTKYVFGSFQDISEAKVSEIRIKELNENLEVRIAELTAELEKLNFNLAGEIAEKNALNESLQAKTAELIRSEKWYRRLVETIHEVIFQVNKEGIMTYISPQIEKMSGYQPEELIGSGTLQLVYPEDIPVIREALSHLSEDGIVQYEFRYFAKTGKIGWMKTSTSYLVENGAVVGRSGSMVDITLQKEYEEEIRKVHSNLEEALMEARQANQAKSDFLSRMSHELRTPLNAILGFAQILKMGDLNSIQRKGVQRIMEGGDHLLDLINDVLDITGLEAGNLRLIQEPFRICDVFTELLDYIQPIADNRQVSIKIEDTSGCDAVLKNDRKRFLQAMKNLVMNAVKFNRIGGTVVIRTVLRDGENAQQILRVLVTDTGIGICEEDMKKLFRPFETILPAQPDAGGTGLGLAVVKKLLEAIGGSVGAESVPGQGSTFWIELSC